MIFFYIRHGDPIYNPDSLTPLGMRQADAIAKRLSLYGKNQEQNKPSHCFKTRKAYYFVFNGSIINVGVYNK